MEVKEYSTIWSPGARYYGLVDENGRMTIAAVERGYQELVAAISRLEDEHSSAIGD